MGREDVSVLGRFGNLVLHFVLLPGRDATRINTPRRGRHLVLLVLQFLLFPVWAAVFVLVNGHAPSQNILSQKHATSIQGLSGEYVQAQRLFCLTFCLSSCLKLKKITLFLEGNECQGRYMKKKRVKWFDKHSFSLKNEVQK